MNAGQRKIVEFLRTAYATELGLIKTLQAHSETAQEGDYKRDLQHHLTETTRHARLVRERLDELGYRTDENVIERAVGQVQALAAQGFALAKTPWDLVRGKGDIPETMLKNAQDEAMAEAKEIGVYLALERIADNTGDVKTAGLASEIRKDEEAMLMKLGQAIPHLAERVVRSQVSEEPIRIAG